MTLADSLTKLIRRKHFVDLEWVVYLHRAVLDTSPGFLTSS
ncbi:hypothetical protein [Nostoc punctiforme]|jgi:hypothetical protein|nr:hypothetical protein [Nostoc punctiforme]